MTTWAATGYVPRLLEVAGLADVIVYVASDERYNDEVPTQFLKLLLQTGKPVVVCLMKMQRGRRPARWSPTSSKEVLASCRPARPSRVLAIPYLTPEQLADPVRKAGGVPHPAAESGGRPGQPAGRGAQAHASSRPAATTCGAPGAAAAPWPATTWRRWRAGGRWSRPARPSSTAATAASTSTSEKFRGFDEALVRLLELLELPGVGQVGQQGALRVRDPYRLLRGLLGKALTRPDAPSLPEQPVLEEALAGWLDLLRKEAARRKRTHPLWAHIDQGFAGRPGRPGPRALPAGLPRLPARPGRRGGPHGAGDLRGAGEEPGAAERPARRQAGDGGGGDHGDGSDGVHAGRNDLA